QVSPKTGFRVTGHCSDELATRGALDWGGHRELDTEFVWFMGLTFADAFHLRGVQGINLGAALAVTLGQDEHCPPQRRAKYLFQGLFAELLRSMSRMARRR